MTERVLKQRKTMHARISRGALYCYDILDGDLVVGTKTVHIDKKFSPWRETATYVLGTIEFATAADFRAAYEQKCRDDEWSAAALKEGGLKCPNLPHPSLILTRWRKK